MHWKIKGVLTRCLRPLGLKSEPNTLVLTVLATLQLSVLSSWVRVKVKLYQWKPVSCSLDSCSGTKRGSLSALIDGVIASLFDRYANQAIINSTLAREVGCEAFKNYRILLSRPFFYRMTMGEYPRRGRRRPSIRTSGRRSPRSTWKVRARSW